MDANHLSGHFIRAPGLGAWRIVSGFPSAALLYSRALAFIRGLQPFGFPPPRESPNQTLERIGVGRFRFMISSSSSSTSLFWIGFLADLSADRSATSIMRNPALYYFAGAILVTLVTTALLCRSRIARGKRSFFLASLAADLIANAVWFVLFFLSGRFYADGWRVFTREAWASGSQHSLESALSDAGLFTVIGAFICMLPVLGVAFYYDRRSKKDQTHVA